MFLFKIKSYAFIGPSGTGKSYRAQYVAGQRNIKYIIDDGLLIKDNQVMLPFFFAWTLLSCVTWLC